MTTELEIGLYIFILAGFLGYHVITRVPPLLHTPLMSATNAISGISLIGSLVVAAISESEVRKLTISFQKWEQQGLGRPLRQVPEPWEGFRDQARVVFESVFVARPERRRARGEGHAATIRQVKERDGRKVAFERKAVSSLKVSDLDRIKDPDRNGAIIAAIRNWMDDGRKADTLPRSAKGDIISKVRISSPNKPAVLVRGGSADRGEMTRVDVFSMVNKRGKEEWYLVPIYPHQVMDKRGWPHPPMRSVAANKDEDEWGLIGESHRFRFSLYPRTYVQIIKPNGEQLAGYFQSLNRSTGAINLFIHNDTKVTFRSIGARTLKSFVKHSVDRFGHKFVVHEEVRTWHGVACTSPTPPG